MGFLIPPNPFTNFEIQKYYQNEPRLNGVFWRNNLPKKVKNRAYLINRDEYAYVRTHWIALCYNKNEIFSFDNFCVKRIPKEIKSFMNNKNTIASIFQIQANDSVMCG